MSTLIAVTSVEQQVIVTFCLLLDDIHVLDISCLSQTG